MAALFWPKPSWKIPHWRYPIGGVPNGQFSYMAERNECKTDIPARLLNFPTTNSNLLTLMDTVNVWYCYRKIFVAVAGAVYCALFIQLGRLQLGFCHHQGHLQLRHLQLGFCHQGCLQLGRLRLGICHQTQGFGYIDN